MGTNKGQSQCHRLSFKEFPSYQRPVYRKFSLAKGKALDEFNLNYQVGNRVADKGFASTSHTDAWKTEFEGASREPVQNTERVAWVRLRIQSKSAKDLMPVASHQCEMEALYPSGTR